MTVPRADPLGATVSWSVPLAGGRIHPPARLPSGLLQAEVDGCRLALRDLHILDLRDEPVLGTDDLHVVRGIQPQRVVAVLVGLEREAGAAAVDLDRGTGDRTVRPGHRTGDLAPVLRRVDRHG